MRRLLFGVVVATLFAAAPVSAAKSEPSTIILNEPSGLAPWQPTLGDVVTFTVTFPKTLDPSRVNIQILCYQNGAITFVTAGHYDRGFLLGGTTSPWLTNGGDATCRGELYFWSPNGQKYNMLASTEFDARGLR